MSNSVSVAMCTYNGAAFLQQQLESILEQTVAADEIILCDDCSTDETITIAEKMLQQFQVAVKIIRNEKNIGVVQNFAKAIALCSNEFIFLSDQDDVWHADKIEKTIALFNANPAVDGICSNANLLQEDEKNSNTIWQARNIREILGKGNESLLDKMLLYGNLVTGACLAIRKRVVDYILPIPPTAAMLHDEWIAFKLAEKNALLLTAESLIDYRIHAQQKTFAMWQGQDIKARAIRLAIINDTEEFSFEQYQHWSRRQKFAKHICSIGIDIPATLKDTIARKKKQSLFDYFRSFNFFTRKKKLLAWWLHGEEVHFKDIFTV